jgi:hypothetical protein
MALNTGLSRYADCNLAAKPANYQTVFVTICCITKYPRQPTPRSGNRRGFLVWILVSLTCPRSFSASLNLVKSIFEKESRLPTTRKNRRQVGFFFCNED